MGETQNFYISVSEEECGYEIVLEHLGPSLFGHHEYSVSIDGNVLGETILHRPSNGSFSLFKKVFALIQKTEDGGEDGDDAESDD